MRPLISTRAESGMTVQRYAAMPNSGVSGCSSKPTPERKTHVTRGWKDAARAITACGPIVKLIARVSSTSVVLGRCAE
jgi:hypothetical protein